ncbi:FeoB-associated Cys-rich membrane protein [Vagococcus lutrae]|uniref:FeoB-associated Cys-rich membrane protein n=1 Tax=Vagococcus lutrae TaxID=81947 RepID=A0AAE9XH52_9ENTE|nr:FeoB-associated Cys-rich membrane protein [Vagococcus lutrae]WCG21855.1 FeoB-associated Cys-rich membrane protein [Vagococcus lutrae]
MGTIILASIIFSSVALVIYKYGIKKESSCDCSGVECPVKGKKVKATESISD